MGSESLSPVMDPEETKTGPRPEYTGDYTKAEGFPVDNYVARKNRIDGSAEAEAARKADEERRLAEAKKMIDKAFEEEK